MTSLHTVARFDDLSAERATCIELDQRKIMLVRDGGTVHAYGAECPHAGAPLHEGAICAGRIVCPWHKATFRVSDGALLEPPALDALTRYPVSVEHGDVRVASTPLAHTAAAPLRTPADAQERRTMAIIGAGAAGVAAAAALRAAGFEGRVLLIGREPWPPYDRTALSKFVIAGGMQPADIPPLRPADFYDKQQIERIDTEVTGLDARHRRITLADGRTLSYDAALIATGGAPKPVPLPGATLPGVFLLRSRQDAAAILAAVRPGARAVILGASFIGLEAASALRQAKVHVTVVAPDAVPFVKQFGEPIGSMFRTLHERDGVVFRLQANATRFDGDANGNSQDAGHVTSVTLDSGETLAADFVIVGVGVKPATEFLKEDSGVALRDDGGIAVDATLRVTGVEGLYAAGDIAAFPLVEGAAAVRIEHWRVAQQHGRVAAHGMLGHAESYEGVPFFWTYHAGKRFDYIGHATQWDDTIIDGDLDRQTFVALLLANGRVVAVVGCQREHHTALLAERMRAPLMKGEALRLISA